MNKQFLVIGSNSFSGASFINYLLNKGYEVFGVSRSKELEKVFLPYRWSSKKNSFQFIKIDLNNDLSKLIKIIKDNKIGYIVNFAAQGMVAESWLNPHHWYQTNVLAQVKLHDKLRKLEFIEKYVHVSTPEVYGNTNGWVKENFNFSPSTPYAVSRAACDLHLMSFYKAYNFPVTFTRASNVYGPGQQLYRIIPRTLLFALTGRKLQLHGGGSSERSFIHIDDVADATLKIALDGKQGDTYPISPKTTLSIKELVKTICKLTDNRFVELVEETEERLGKDQSYLLKSTKLRRELRWEDRIDLNSGLNQTLTWVRENLKTLNLLPLNYQHKP